MADMSLSGVGIQIHGLVENIPSTISGAILLNLIDQQRRFIELYTGLTVGSPTISDRFQLPLINLTIAELLHYMQLVGVDASSVSIGDFSISKGQGSNFSDAANLFRERGIEQLKNVGWRGDMYQSI